MDSRVKNINFIKQTLFKGYHEYIPGDRTIEFTPSEVSEMLTAANELAAEFEKDKWKRVAADLCTDLDNDIDDVAERLQTFANENKFDIGTVQQLCDLDSSWMFGQIY